jgi:hypothetical protein
LATDKTEIQTTTNSTNHSDDPQVYIFIIFAPPHLIIDTLLKALSKKFLLQGEGDDSVSLGVQVKKDIITWTISLKQPGLIEPVIKDVSLDKYSKGRDTCKLHSQQYKTGYKHGGAPMCLLFC